MTRLHRWTLWAGLATSLGLVTPAQAWQLGRWLLDGANPTTVSIEASSTGLIGTSSESRAGTWHLVLTPDGPRLAPTPLRHCNGVLFAKAAPFDARGDGRLDLAAGDRLRVYVAASLQVPLARSWLVALSIDSRGQARVLWSLDDRELPGLGRVLVPPTVLHRRNADPTAAPEELLAVGAGSPITGRPLASAPLFVVRADSGRVLNSSLDLHAGVPGGITALDVDADGLTDRLYLADDRHRVWRLALAHDGDPNRIDLRAREIASLGAGIGAGAALIQAPDLVATRDARGDRLWQVTVGTSDLPNGNAREHWLFQFDEPARDADRVDATSLPVRTATSGSDASATAAAAGYRLRLPGPLASPVLTVDGRRLIATTANSASRPCRDGAVEREAMTVTAVDPDTGSRPLPIRLTLPSDPGAPLRAEWPVDGTPGGGRLQCRLGDDPLDLCPQIPALQRRWWSRSDAP